MMKKGILYKIIICFCIICMFIPVVQVKAMINEEKINEELKIAIISGDGSEDNPFMEKVLTRLLNRIAIVNI